MDEKKIELKDWIPLINGMNCILAMTSVEKKIMDLDISKNQKALRNLIRVDTKDKLFRK